MPRRSQVSAHKVALGLAAGVASAAVIALLPAIGATRTIEGTARSLDVQGVKGGTDYVIELTDGRRFTWACGARSCRNVGDALAQREVRWSLPAPTLIRVRHDTVIGLEIAGRRLIEPGPEVARRQGDVLGVALLLGGLVGASCVFAAGQQGRGRQRNSTPEAS
jgi:hypothetical protein